MTRIFISHSHKNNWPAAILHDYLEEEGWGPVFLDIHPESGLNLGESWEQALARAGQSCLAVVCLISKEWLSSAECLSEYTFARYGNASSIGSGRKKIIPILLEEVDFSKFPAGLSRWQAISLSDSTKDGAFGLRQALSSAGLSRSYFEYNPRANERYNPYKAFKPLGEEDAAVLFGRQTEIDSTMRAISRAASSDGQEQIIRLVGPSGSGKSSLLRAGVLPRLKRDFERYIVFPTIVGSRYPISGMRDGQSDGLIEAMKSLAESYFEEELDTQSIFGGEAQFSGFLSALRERHLETNRLTQYGVIPKIVIVVDQHEEIVHHQRGDSTGEANRFVAFLTDIIQKNSDVIVVYTSRGGERFLYNSDQSAPMLEVAISLTSVELVDFREIVLGPSTVAKPKFHIDENVVDAILSDLEERGLQKGGNWLPVVALSMSQMFSAVGRDNRITLKMYREIGDISQSIQRIIDRFADETKYKESELANALAQYLIELSLDGSIIGIKRQSTEIPPHIVSMFQAASKFRIVEITKREGIEWFRLSHDSIAYMWPHLTRTASKFLEPLSFITMLNATAKAASLSESVGLRTAASSQIVLGRKELRNAKAISKDNLFGGRFTAEAKKLIFDSRRKQNKSAIRVGSVVTAGVAVLITGLLIFRVYSSQEMAMALAESDAGINPWLAIAAAPPDGAVVKANNEIGPCSVGPNTTRYACLIREAGIAEKVVRYRILHDFFVGNAVFLMDRSIVATISQDNSVVIWDWGVDTEPLRLIHENDPIGVAASDRTIASLDRAGGIYFNGVKDPALSLNADVITAEAFRDKIVFSTFDGNVGIIDAARRQVKNSDLSVIGFANNIWYHEKSQSVFGLGYDNRLLVFDSESMAIEHSIVLPNGIYPTAVSSPKDGDLIFLSFSNGHLYSFDTNTQSIEILDTSLFSSVKKLKTYASQHQILALDEKNFLSIVSLKSQLQATIVRANFEVQTFEYLPQTGLIALADKAGGVRILEAATEVEVARIRTRLPVIELKFDIDENALVSVDEKGEVAVYELRDLGRLSPQSLRKAGCERPLNRYRLSEVGVSVESRETIDNLRWPFVRTENPCDWKGVRSWLSFE